MTLRHMASAAVTLKPPTPGANQRCGAPRPSQIAPASSITSCQRVMRATMMFETMQNDKRNHHPLQKLQCHTYF